MDIVAIAVIGTLNVVCFLIGSKIGQTVVKGKDIQLPNINPIKAYQEHQERKETEYEKNKLDIILKNIERYDGTDNGQEDVPK